MMRAEKLCAGYGGRAVLHDVSIAVDKGGLTGVLGPNGAGKSTLLLALAGVLHPTSGKVEVDGRDLAGLDARDHARLTASVPQRAEPAFGLRVLSVVLMGRLARQPLFGGLGPDDYAAAFTAMRETGIEHLAQRPCDHLSGGEYQRVLIARALAQDTPLLLLDEAASNLDAAARIRVHDLIAARCASGLTALAVLHDLNLAALYCDRLVFLKKGRVAHQGPTAEVFTREILMEIYETDLDIVAHPRTGAPQVLFAPGAAAPAV